MLKTMGIPPVPQAGPLLPLGCPRALWMLLW